MRILTPSIKRVSSSRGRGKFALPKKALFFTPEGDQLPEPIFIFGKVRITKSLLRGKIAKASPVRNWELGGGIGESTIANVPNFGKVMIKPCFGSKSPEKTMATLVEMIRRRVRFESPLGLLVSRNQTFLVTKYLPGQGIGSVLAKASREQALQIARMAGKELADLHSKGFTHGHPHFQNMLLVKNKLRLIDATLAEDITKLDADQTKAKTKNDIVELSKAFGIYSTDLANAFLKAYTQSQKNLHGSNPF